MRITIQMNNGKVLGVLSDIPYCGVVIEELDQVSLDKTCSEHKLSFIGATYDPGAVQASFVEVVRAGKNKH